MLKLNRNGVFSRLWELQGALQEAKIDCQAAVEKSLEWSPNLSQEQGSPFILGLNT